MSARFWASAALALVAACAETEPPSAGPGRGEPGPAPTFGASTAISGTLAPVVRLVEEENRRAATARKGDGEPVVVGDVARPVLDSGPAPQHLKTPCDLDSEDPDAPCRYTLPASPRARWLLVAPLYTPDATRSREMLRKRVGGPLPRRSYHVVPGGPESRTLELPAWDAGPVEVREILPLKKRWVETPPVKIREGAILRFSTAVEPAALEIDSAPVVFEIVGYEGSFGRTRPLLLFQSALDPASPESRHWRHHEVSLRPLWGKRGRLLFRTRPRERGDLRPQLPVWGDPTILAPQPRRRPPRPYVVLISLDTLRARSLSTLGRSVETSPGFDALARQGTLFEQTFTTYANTLGSHMSLLTGLWPQNHGVKGNARLGPSKRTLAERLRAAGWITAAFTEDGLLRGAAGFWRGFGLYSENKEVKTGAGASRETFDAALAWARAHRDTPFFLFVHTYEVHAPYAPTSPYDTLFADEGFRSRAHRRYEQEIRYLDDQLRHLVGELDRLLGSERLLLVVVADHGEEFYEHGSAAHTQLYDEVMHVPLLFRWPGRVPAGHRVTTPVSLVDVAPTLLGLLGVRSGRAADGQSLVTVIDGGDADRGRVLFGEAPATALGRRQTDFVGRTATLKCMIGERDEAARCFDLVADPEEKSPFPAAHDPAMRALARAVRAYRDRAALPAEDEGPTERPHADPKLERKLRALGYVE